MQPTNRPVNAVELRDVTKTFGKVVANDHVSLDIRKGEILSLLGENGSGKTTLMNMLAGIYFPDSGQILVDGKEGARSRGRNISRRTRNSGSQRRPPSRASFSARLTSSPS